MHWLKGRRVLRAFSGVAGAVSLAAAVSGTAHGLEVSEFDFGFLASRRVLEDGSVQTRALGPVWERRQADGEARFVACRPLYSFEAQPDERFQTDWLWPLGIRRDIEEKVSARILLTYFMDADRTDSESAWRFWFLPLYFQGRADTGEDYLAVFPLGGDIRGIFFQDRVSFWLFPLRWTAQVNQIEGGGWLWPIFSQTQGEDVERFRVFPFYGRSSTGEDVTKKFILWPFYTEARYGPEAGNGSAWILFPLTGYIELEDQKGFWLLPPLFRFHHGEKQSMYYLPWPFIQIGRGEIDKFYLWPLYGTRTIDRHKKTFFLWPFIHHRHMDDSVRNVDRWTAWPFWYSDTLTRNKNESSTEYTYRKLWPLFSYKAFEEERRFRMLDLWPTRDQRSVDRNWAPFWTLFESKASGPERETEFLWGLYRAHSVEGQYRYWSLFPFFDKNRDLQTRGSEWNLLKGLIGREKDADGTRWKLLYFIRWESENL